MKIKRKMKNTVHVCYHLNFKKDKEHNIYIIHSGLYITDFSGRKHRERGRRGVSWAWLTH